jgi:hypothetical protein
MQLDVDEEGEEDDEPEIEKESTGRETRMPLVRHTY